MGATLPDKEMLRMLGAGEPAEAVCAVAGISRRQFDAWWSDQLASRQPQMSGARRVSVTGDVEIVRDEWGVPHIFAEGDQDLFFGYGLAMAQDRLWQLDYLRRKALGRLAEILGPRALEQDVMVRTVGINRIAAREVDGLPAATFRRLDAFARGINTAMQDWEDQLPVEFDLLDYAPEPWSPLDSVAIWAEFRWYLTGRLPIIALPELARRTLGDGRLYQAFLTPEAGDESILPEGSYPARLPGVERTGEVAGDPEDGVGSNNWVVAGARSASGAPMVASDPHIAFGSVSCWYEAHLSGGGLNVAGAGYVGLPAVVFGRGERVAWGVTNNICSQRDLYREKTDPDHPDCFLFDGKWEPATELTEEITVRGEETVRVKVRSSRNGPIVDGLLPPPARNTGPVSLRWLGSTFCDELSCLLAANRARTCAEFREALRGWRVPTWSFVFADVDGHIGYQCVGRIPVRAGRVRGYRRGWDPEDTWQGLVPLKGMPALVDPPQGWIRSANNRTAPEDFPYPLSGTWSSGLRARRIRQMISEKPRLSRADFDRMQMDVLSLRAVEALPPLLVTLAETDEPRVRRAAALLGSWDCRMDPESVAASAFEVFFQRWCEAVAAERFQNEEVSLMAGAIGGLAMELLAGDGVGWFSQRNRKEAVLAAFSDALDELEARLGPDMSEWTWGRIHTISLKHYLSEIGELSELLDRGGQPVGGSGVTVCNTGFDLNYLAAAGANYRLVAELGDGPPTLWSVDAAGQSGNPGSTHYCDQLPVWLAGRHRQLPLDRERVEASATSSLLLTPID